MSEYDLTGVKVGDTLIVGMRYSGWDAFTEGHFETVTRVGMRFVESSRNGGNREAGDLTKWTIGGHRYGDSEYSRHKAVHGTETALANRQAKMDRMAEQKNARLLRALLLEMIEKMAGEDLAACCAALGVELVDGMLARIETVKQHDPSVDLWECGCQECRRLEARSESYFA